MQRRLNRISRIFLTSGFKGLLVSTTSYFRQRFRGKAKSFAICHKLFAEKKGIEIGGPSPAFTRRGFFPVYPIASYLDNCNFASATIWQGNIASTQEHHFDRFRSCGRQYIAEATDLSFLPADSYDFILSSHVLEHVANPILALYEWIQLLREEGTMVLILPHRERTFDHRRPITKMEHLIADFAAGIGEDDQTHLAEIFALHDLKRDPEAGSAEAFKARARRNLENRCLHHHVFDTALVTCLVEYVGLKIEALEEIAPFHILIVARKRG